MGSIPTTASRLFQPFQLTPSISLTHRIAMAPLTRFRATDEHVPTPALAGTYYSQRASSLPGTLLVTEATFISPTAGGFDNVPGIYNDAQIAAWREITNAVHAKGGHIFLQLWSLGRAAKESVATKEGFVVHGASALPIPDDPSAATPVEMTTAEVRTRIAEYATAAKNAIAAGFDGVEVHGANGYLVDQFTQDVSNQRTDEYGGSIENRSRFAVEVVQAVVDAVGAERTGIRLSPWARFQGMRMQDPIPQFEDLIRKISVHGLAYLHLVQRRIDGSEEAPESTAVEGESLDFAVNLWNGPLLITGSLSPNQAKYLVDEEYKDKNVLATFGRYFISNPDLPFRIKEGIPLNKYDRNTFYTPKSPIGYIDQPFSKEFEALHGAQSVKL